MIVRHVLSNMASHESEEVSAPCELQYVARYPRTPVHCGDPYASLASVGDLAYHHGRPEAPAT
jgi:hypothetical protein